MGTLAAIGLLTLILGAIWLIDLIFFKEDRVARIREGVEKTARIQEQMRQWKILESYTVGCRNDGDSKDEVLYKLSIRYDGLDEDRANSFVNRYYQ